MEQKLIALKVMRYNGQSLEAGEAFMAKSGHVRPLVAMRAARVADDADSSAPVTAPAVVEEVAPEPETETAGATSEAVESEADEAEDKSIEPASDAPKRRGRPPKAAQ